MEPQKIIELLAILVPILSSIINALTPHFSKYQGIKKWVLWIVEMLSVVASKGSDKGLKPPFVSRPPE